MDFRYPVAMTDVEDGIYYGAIVKILLETGWVYHHPDLSASFGLKLFDFPHFDALHLLVMKLIGYIVCDWAIVLNIYYLLTYLLSSITAVLFFRSMRYPSSSIYYLSIVIHLPALPLLAWSTPYYACRLLSVTTANAGNDLAPISSRIARWRKCISVKVMEVPCSLPNIFCSCICRTLLHSFCAYRVHGRCYIQQPTATNLDMLVRGGNLMCCGWSGLYA
jgi:hypothetical protein